MIKFIKWFFSSSKKPITEHIDLYDKIVELENRIAKLEDENIETSNRLCELETSIKAVDSRIDILSVETLTKKCTN